MVINRSCRLLRPAAIAAALMTVGSVTAGCTALIPSSPVVAPPAAVGRKLTGTEVAAAGQVTLRMTDFETTGGTTQALDRIIRRFETDYPNINVERDSKAFSDYGKTIQLTMSSANAPDIAEANVVMARRLIPGGLVRPLDSYYSAYGWKQRYPATVRGLLQAEPSGKTFGRGSFWGQSLGGNLVGVYYNAEKLHKLGLTVPRTFAEFEAALATAKAKGELPLQTGNLEQVQANHVLSTVMNDFEDPDAISRWVNGEPGATFQTPGIEQAAEIVRDWAAKGYFPSGTNGIREDDAAAAFASGEGVFDITGSWRDTAFDQALGDDGGFFLLPPRKPGGHPSATGWLMNPLTVSSRSRHADLAAFFLDYASGPRNAEINLAGGNLPFTGALRTTGGPVAADVLAAWRTAVKDGSLVPYLDFATPSMGDTLFPALQSVLAGQMTTDRFTAVVQADWTAYHSGS